MKTYYIIEKNLYRVMAENKEDALEKWDYSKATHINSAVDVKNYKPKI